jgi:hypothetical protein
MSAINKVDLVSSLPTYLQIRSKNNFAPAANGVVADIRLSAVEQINAPTKIYVAS